MVDDVDGRELALSDRLPVVGIGASAGGIQALKALLGALPERIDAAIVVIVHLDPSHASELASILAAQTRLRVVQVSGRMALQPSTVYVIPPDRRLLLTGNDISAATFDEPRGQRAPIDLFFRSMADQHGDGFAVILSGSGSDGAVGVKAVKEKGGLILVQDPNEAEYPMMPRSAIAAGADFVLPAEALATQIIQLVNGKRTVTVHSLGEQDDQLRRILAYVRSKTGQDFSRYKRATVMRRLARRMQVAQTEVLEQYLTYLRENAEEVQALYNDLLISVTSFFRDPDAFAILAQEVIARLFENELSEKPLRIWVPGCATGEEAYSIAILLLEEAARRDARPDIQVFASDLDSSALATAREGRYPAAIAADVNEERLRRFFTREGEHFRIRREVRDIVVFASHSLLKDPPFSRLDLISCRNLLIYLDRELQQQVCGIFHYALVPRGFLFLGASETADNPTGFFNVVDRDARIYQAIDRPSDMLPAFPRSHTMVRIPELPGAARPSRPAMLIDAALHRQALEEMAPPSLVVDESHLIINMSETAGRYLLHPSGPVTNDAAEIVRPELRLELRAALHRAFEHNEKSLSLPIPVQFNGTPTAVVLQVRPIAREDAPRTALVLFVEGGPIAQPSTDVPTLDEQSAVVTQLREELLATRTVLRTTREQYETATEELRAANEELQSINEEYRSTAEELETSKEELQSINEELQTLNNELKLKLEMVSRAHSDLQNLMGATDVGTLFLDATLRIKRFTARTTDLFNVVAGDEGRPITDFTHRLEYQELIEDCRRVLAHLTPIERTARTNDDRWFMVRVRPYRTIDDKIEGVVITFVDVSERRRADEAWAQRQGMLLAELSHRVKNTLAVVQAIVRNTLTGSGASKNSLAVLDARLLALAQAHDILVHNEWRGANLEELAAQQLKGYLGDRLRLSGPEVLLPPPLATPFALVLHELGTNASKYGAFSQPHGTIEVTWRTYPIAGGDTGLEFVWREHGAPAQATPPKIGFGNTLIDRCIPHAESRREWSAGGLRFTLNVPLSVSSQ